MASSNVIIRKCEGQGINVQDLNGLAYSDTKQDVMISRRFMHTYISVFELFLSSKQYIIWQDNSKVLFN